MAQINWNKAVLIEHEVQKIIQEQEENGFYFDKEKAEEYIKQLTREREEIFKQVKPLLRPIVDHSRATVERPYTIRGELSIRARNYITNPSTIGGPFSPVSFIEPDMGSRKQLMDQLKFHGWKATELTEKGNERLTEDSLMMLEGDLGKKIARWYILRHRQSQIESWLKKVRPDHRISALANTCGTPTGRMRHSVVVNVPKAEDHVIFGKEMRSLFTVPPGKVLIGHDASGLELRLLAHYLNDNQLTHEILEGDFHSKVWSTIDTYIKNRSNSKNIFYAFCYGAQDPKLGSMADTYPKGMNLKKVGENIRISLMKGMPALGKLTEDVKKQAKRSYLVGLDGRKLIVRSEHSALNTLLQGAGAIVMKMSMILLDRSLRREGIKEYVKKVGDFHDEAQAEIEDSKEIIELYSKLAVQSVKESGEYFKLNCPLDAEAKVGLDWSMTH